MNLAPTDQYQVLFLDRDGVINERRPGQYVVDWSDFSFMPGVLESLARLNECFQRILIVTNQQGIGKGLMTHDDLTALHRRMRIAIEDRGGRIDGIYSCPDLATVPGNCRKPASAMGEWAKNDFPDIEYKEAVMVGDSLSDLQFGRNLGMLTVHITTKRDELLTQKEKDQWVDLSFSSLEAFTEWWLT